MERLTVLFDGEPIPFNLRMPMPPATKNAMAAMVPPALSEIRDCYVAGSPGEGTCYAEHGRVAESADAPINAV